MTQFLVQVDDDLLYVYVCGGWDGYLDLTFCERLQVYSKDGRPVDGAVWTPVADLPAAVRELTLMAYGKNSLLAFGGISRLKISGRALL